MENANREGKSMRGRERIHIGTSGWHYRHWKGPFYPADLPAGKMLAFYARQFHAAEINNSFYRLPEKETFIQWREAVPAGFLFAVKASRFITHMKKLKDPQEPLAAFLERASVLGDRLGPVLFQLPPRWGCNIERLRTFLEALPGGFRYAFEFRDESWFNTEVYRALTEFKASFCIYDLAGRLSPKEITSDLVYIRLHGPDGAYQGEYGPQALSGWAGALAAWARQGKEIFCFFDNDQAGYAARDAGRLLEMTGKKG
jgi:uncharacterized protein YecE (DUF72 family)